MIPALLNRGIGFNVGIQFEPTLGLSAGAPSAGPLVYPCGIVFVKVSAGFVGQLPIPEIVFIALP